MPGTVVRDAIAANLLDGVALTGTGAVTGPVTEVVWPQDVAFAFETATVGGTNPTAQITIEGADNAAFDSGVVRVVAFPVTTGSAASQSDEQYQVTTYVDKRYVRAVLTKGGTSPDYTGATLKAVLPHDRRVRATTSAN